MQNSQFHVQSEERVAAEIGQEEIISFQSKIPLPLNVAMRKFIEMHPNWDQYRLIQAALAGFLVQNGIDSRPITRLYIENMFHQASS